MKTLNTIMLTLIIIGAVNWGLVGIFKFDVVKYIFGSLTVVSRIIYTLIGIAGLWCTNLFAKILQD